MTERTKEQNDLTHELLRELPLMENKAMRAGLHITTRAIQNAVRASGWEAAGESAKAVVYAPNTDGLPPEKPNKPSADGLRELIKRAGVARFDEGYAGGRRMASDGRRARELADSLELECLAYAERLAGGGRP